MIGCASGENADNGYPPHESRSHGRFFFSVALDSHFPRGGGTNEEVVSSSINRVRYNDEEHILAAVGLPPEHICTYCISGRDPFKR